MGKLECAVSKNIHTQISWGRGVQGDQKKKSITYIWNFQRGREVLVKIPSVGEVWIFFWNYTIQFFLILSGMYM